MRRPRPKPAPEIIEFQVEVTAQDIAQAHEDGITGEEMLERAVERAVCELERKLKLN
jgi:hypothetical protein